MIFHFSHSSFCCLLYVIFFEQCNNLPYRNLIRLVPFATVVGYEDFRFDSLNIFF